MKKKILFLVALWLLFGVAHSQTINSENSGALKIVPIGTPAPKGMVNVTLQVSANIPNGNGYMLLLDPTATTYGTVFPASGFLSYNCALAPGFMDAFAFKIPYNAEPICTTPNVVFDNSITIQITSGIYDYVIPNPLQQYGYWSIAPNPYGRQHNYEFEEGYHYTFVVDYNPAQSLELIITEDIPDTGTPSAVSDLTVTPDNTNDLQAVISWSNPTETSGGDPLTELTAIKVYQNFGATPIYTNSNPEIGGEESFTVTVPEQGSYVFMVVGENTVGVGTPTTAEVKFCSRISSFPYEEGFETSTGTSFPVCWDQEFVAGSKFWEVVPYHIGTPWTAQEGTQKARFSGAQGVKTKLITAPFDLSAVEHPVLNFWHTQRISFQYLDKLRIYYKNSAAGEWNFLVEYMTEVYDWTERYISLPNKSSEYYIAFEAEAQNAHGVQLDAVRVLEMVGLDGAAIKLFGVTTPMVNEPYVFKAQIMNVAGETLSGYSVKLVDDENNILDINEEGEDIVSMESKMISLRFTPTTTGPLSIRAIFELPEDVNPANDKSPFLNLNIQPQNQIFTSFVGGDNILRKTVPFNFDYGLSRVQSIYYDHEIIGRAGVITQLQYFSSFADNITGEFAEQLQIWMANTTADRLDTWLLPESEFTLVWDALVEIPFGQQTITLNLSNPFVYEGKNIVIMTNRPICNIMYNNDEFYTSETPEFVNRGREYHSMAYEFNWKYPGEAINYFPDIKMKFGLVGAKVTGKITSDGTTPLEGATVELIGPNADQYFNRTTDAEGNYSFDFLMDGSYQFKATKLGHSDATSTPLSVVAGSDYEVDLTLAPLSTFAMSGKVTANDLPNGVPNAEVKLSGYNTYSTIADETGNYSIPNIFANKTYNIETSKTGYVTYQSTVNIEDNNVTYNIMLNEIAWAVGRPLAEIVSENVEVTWVQPETFQEKTYVLDDGTAEEAYSFSTYDGAYGNMFVVGEEGEIISIDVFGVYHEYNMDRPINI
ncbi:MAG: carboxypeptidase-like regulatory domain-containing protein, partial [Bacteroidales bacterium]|nr:carboxypeptidase-like regulatory domain-containing protein [Bacteroidales bacterium]